MNYSNRSEFLSDLKPRTYASVVAEHAPHTQVAEAGAYTEKQINLEFRICVDWGCSLVVEGIRESSPHPHQKKETLKFILKECLFVDCMVILNSWQGKFLKV